MNPRDPALFEAELGRLQPARPPPELTERLLAARPALPPQPRPQPPPTPRPVRWSVLFRWLAPALGTALALTALLVWRLHILNTAPRTDTQSPAESRPSNLAALPGLKADDVEIDRRLITAFEAVATLPTGEPVRFRCAEWSDAVVLRDRARGVVIEQRTPRFEVVPVGFETY